MIRNYKVVELERKIAQLIIDKLEKNQITLERAQEIARYTLKIIREDMNDGELTGVITKLDGVYVELTPIVTEELKKLKETTAQKI